MLYRDRAGIEIYAVPLQAQDLTAAQPINCGELDNWEKIFVPDRIQKLR